MLELNRVERRALLLGSALAVLGAGARLGLGPGPASYAWHPVSGVSPETGPGGLGRARAESAAALEREEHARRPLEEGERVDPNRDPEEELRRLPGIGPSRARAVVEAREAGRFRCREELARVPGIGPATVRRLVPHLALPGCGTAPGAGPGPPASRPPPPAGARPAMEARLDVNTASAEELERLPWVGPSRAAQIVRTRERLGGFRSVEELLEVPGIGPVVLERIRPRVRLR